MYNKFYCHTKKNVINNFPTGESTIGNGRMFERRGAADFERQNGHASSRGCHSRGAKDKECYAPRYSSRDIRGILLSNDIYIYIYTRLKRERARLNFPRWKYLFVQDVQIGGYDVPCGAMIVPMQWAVHTDPAYWRDPLEFRPDRFLSDDGSFFKPESFLPFQNGKKID